MELLLFFSYKDAMEGVSKKQYKWLQEQVEVNREERIKALKKRQESPTQVCFVCSLI